MIPEPPTAASADQPAIPEPLLWRTRVRIVAATADALTVDVLGWRDAEPLTLPTADVPAWVAALQPGDRAWAMAGLDPIAPGGRVIGAWIPREPWMDIDNPGRPLTEERIEAIRAELGHRVSRDVGRYITEFLLGGELMFILRFGGQGIPDRIELVDGTILTQQQDNTWDVLAAPIGGTDAP